MRFIEDGVNIPDELLWAHDEGNVVFFCGAGVSRAKAGLPDFNHLTQKVLEELGATDEDDARRLHELAKIASEAHGVGLTISDRVFQLLHRRFTDADIGKKVAGCLKPKDGVDLGAHRTLLRLARLQSGETRIITTNFDRLFEQCNSRLKTVTRSTLPHVAFNTSNWGVVHLHGCVEADYSGPTADGFVLSSAEFGDAYLAKGWAREFVREILNRYVAVFIGYSADDPPIRYLLEGLQLSNPLRNRAYAFQAGENDSATVSWEEKGVEALIYPTESGCGHRRLWESLDRWTRRADNPIKWRARVLKSAQKGPSKLAPHERGMIAHVVSSVSGVEAFAQHEPPISAEWLCVFDPEIRYGEPQAEDGFYGGSKVDPFDRYHLDSDLPPRETSRQFGQQNRMPDGAWSAFSVGSRDLKEIDASHLTNIRGPHSRTVPNPPRRMRLLAHWISIVSDQPTAAWWAGRQASLHHELLARVLFSLKKSIRNRNHVVASAWKAILERHELSDGQNNIDLLDFGRAEPDVMFAREYASRFMPRLRVGKLFRRSVPPVNTPRVRVHDLVPVEIEYSEEMRAVDVPDDYLQLVLPKMRAALELAEELEGRYSYGIDICSIEPDQEEEGDNHRSSYTRQYGLSGHVLLFVDLFKRLAVHDCQAARLELASWPRQSEVFSRLRIWALGNLDILPADAFGEELLALPPTNFWPFRGDRDLLLGLARRWAELAVSVRKVLERRFLNGPPRTGRITGSDFVERSAHRRLSRINWLHSQGCIFSFDLDIVNSRLQALAPSWRQEYAAKAAESNDGKSGLVRSDTDFSAIENLPPREMFAFLDTIDRRPDGAFVAREPFLGLSQERPHQALAALKEAGASESFQGRYWETFLRVDVRKNDSVELSQEIACELLKVSDPDFASIAQVSSNWFRQVGLALLSNAERAFELLWAKFIKAMRMHKSVAQSSLVRQDRAPDWATESINSAPGKLAELAVSISPDPPPVQGKGFPQKWLARVEELLSLPDDSRRYALVIVGHQLGKFFYFDPEWTRHHILRVIESDQSDLDQDAIWAGFFWRARVPGLELFVCLRPSLLRLCRQRTEQRTRHVEILAGMLLVGWGTRHKASLERLVSNNEMRTAILGAGSDFRRSIIWQLRRWSVDEKNGDGWAQQVSEFLRDAWPKHKDIRTAQVSASLCELALSQKSNFPEVAGLVAHLVSKVGEDQLFIPALRNANEIVALEFPDALLGLLYAILPDNVVRWPHGAIEAIRTLGQKHPFIRSDSRFRELENRIQ